MLSTTRTEDRVLVLLLLLFLTACAVPGIPGRVIYEDPTTFIRVEPDPQVQPERPDTFHRHPISISVEQFAGVLRGLKVRDHRTTLHIMVSGEALWEPVFREEEIAVLAPGVIEALAQAQYRERVTYYLSRPQTSIRREITTGGVYIQGNHLHFIIANRKIRYAVPAYGIVYDKRYPTRPTGPKWFDLDFEPADALVKQKASFLDLLLGREKDEVVIDLDKLGLGLPVAQAPLHSSHSLAIFPHP